MKILTVTFLIYYIVKVFRQKGWLVNSLIGMYDLLPKDLKISEVKTYVNNLKGKDKDEYGKQSVKMVGLLLLAIIFGIIEFIYVVKVTAFNCSKIITVGYLIFWILILIKSIISSKAQNSKKDITIAEGLVKLKRYKISQMLINLVDVAYFGYIFYILFIL